MQDATCLNGCSTDETRKYARKNFAIICIRSDGSLSPHDDVKWIEILADNYE
jgi:hypothetical protein